MAIDPDRKGVSVKKYLITDYGAIDDGETPATSSIKNTIDDAHKNGGGIVVISNGRFLAGAIFLKQNVELLIEKSGVLLGSQNIADYPLMETRFEGRFCRWPAALVNADNLKSVKVYGDGTIDGNALPFWEQFWRDQSEAVRNNKPFSNRDTLRPRTIHITNSSDIRIEGLRIINGGFWHVHLYNCENIIARSLYIHAPHDSVRAASTDGLDIDSCRNVSIKNCEIDTDDDCIALKSGKGPNAHLENLPTENIVIEECKFGFGHGAVTFGSEAAVVRNVSVRNCIMDGQNNTIRFKFRSDTEQLFENITFDNITIKNSTRVFQIKPWECRQDDVLACGLPSKIKNLVVRNIKARNMNAPGSIQGKEGLIDIENILLENIDIESRGDAPGAPERIDTHEVPDDSPFDALPISGCSGLVIKNVTLNGRNIF
jgi:polygalacturonase